MTRMVKDFLQIDPVMPLHLSLGAASHAVIMTLYGKINLPFNHRAMWK